MKAVVTAWRLWPCCQQSLIKRSARSKCRREYLCIVHPVVTFPLRDRRLPSLQPWWRPMFPKCCLRAFLVYGKATHQTIRYGNVLPCFVLTRQLPPFHIPRGLASSKGTSYRRFNMPAQPEHFRDWCNVTTASWILCTFEANLPSSTL